MRSNRPAGSSGRMVSVAEPMPAPTSSTRSRRPSGTSSTSVRTTSPIIRFAARQTGASRYRSPAVGSASPNSSDSGSSLPRSTSGRAPAQRRNSPISFAACGKRAVTSSRNASESRGISSGNGSSAPIVTTKPSSFACITPERARISSIRRSRCACSGRTSRRSRSSSGFTTALAYAFPPERFHGRERVAPRRPPHLPLQVGLVRDLDSLIGQIPGERLRAGRRGRRPRQEVRRQHPRRQGAVAPDDLVEQLVDPLHRGKQGAPRRPLDGEAGELAEKLPALGMEAHVRRANLQRPAVSGIVLRIARAFPHRHVAEQPIRQPVAQPEPLPGERQVGDPVLGCVRIARRRHDLKAAVEHERMHVERALLLPGGQHHLAERLAIPRPERGQCAEGGAEVDPDRGLGAVVGGQVHRRERGLAAVDIERRHGRRRAGRAAR